MGLYQAVEHTNELLELSWSQSSKEAYLSSSQSLLAERQNLKDLFDAALLQKLILPELYDADAEFFQCEALELG